MNLYLVLLLGLIAGLCLTAVVYVFVPTQPRLSAVLERMGTTAAVDQDQDGPATSWQNQVGSSILRRFGGNQRLVIPSADLRLIGMSVNRYLYQKVLCAGLGLLAPLAIGVVFQALRVTPFYLPAFLGIPLAIAAWFLPNVLVRDQAAKARTEFSRTAAVYMELVAAERVSGASPSRALEAASQVGKNWAFTRIRRALTEGRYSGVASWDALERLALDIDVPDLAEVAKVIRLSGEEGATVYETLRARSQNLRDRLLNDETTEANQATNRMTIPMALTGVLFFALIGTPFILALLR